MTPTALLFVFFGLVSGAVSEANVSPIKEQIAAAIQAAPEERRDGAAVLGYDAEGKLVTLRQGTNDLICLADQPGDQSFSVACYHKDLEPYMARGRELAQQGIQGKARNDYRWREVEEGKLKMPREPRLLYVLTGTGFDPATGTVKDAYLRWVIYLPFATPESTGLSTASAPGKPWLMDAGTAGAHIMISPPRK
jgi:hypothetical protein